MPKLKAKGFRLFNPDGDDSVESRVLWGGDTTHLMQLNDVRYPWAVALYRQMRENFWLAERTDVTTDVTCYTDLTSAERRAFDGILSYLTFLDSIQTVNLPQLKLPITAPEVSMCLAEQISQEALHNQSYQYLIESIIPGDRRSAVYDFWRTDTLLKDRCEFIASVYQDYFDKQTDESYFTALLADYILEGIYFYNGFCFYYSLASRHLMPGTADIFRLINRDELSHVRLFQKIIPEAMAKFPHSKDSVYELFDTAVRHEIEWTNHIVGNDILGITESSTERYTKYLANTRLKAVGLEPLYDSSEAENCYRHLERFADTSSDASTKANFFESQVTSYVMSSGLTGWEDI